MSVLRHELTVERPRTVKELRELASKLAGQAVPDEAHVAYPTSSYQDTKDHMTVTWSEIK